MKHPWRINETPEARAARKAAEERRAQEAQGRDARWTKARKRDNRFRG